jgi:hypothetical protein
MAKRSKLDTFLEVQEAFKEQPKARGVLTKATINEPENEPIKERYDAYIKAIEVFNIARGQLMAAKTNLQNILDAGLYDQRRISKRRFWTLTLDEYGNIRYRDDDRDYLKAYHGYVHRNTAKKGDRIASDDVSFDWLDTDTPELVEFPTQGTSAGTPEGTYKGTGVPPIENLEQLTVSQAVDEYRKLRTNDKKLDFWNKFNNQQQIALFRGLRKTERKNLHSILSQGDQFTVHAILDEPETP